MIVYVGHALILAGAAFAIEALSTGDWTTFTVAVLGIGVGLYVRRVADE